MVYCQHGKEFYYNVQYMGYEGAKGVQLAELGLKSWAERRWVDVPQLG